MVYRLNITNEWYRWHGAAVQRLGKAFPLEPLARIREAYRTQQVPTEQQLQVRGDAFKPTCCATAAEQCQEVPNIDMQCAGSGLSCRLFGTCLWDRA